MGMERTNDGTLCIFAICISASGEELLGRYLYLCLVSLVELVLILKIRSSKNWGFDLGTIALPDSLFKFFNARFRTVFECPVELVLILKILSSKNRGFDLGTIALQDSLFKIFYAQFRTVFECPVELVLFLKIRSSKNRGFDLGTIALPDSLFLIFNARFWTEYPFELVLILKIRCSKIRGSVWRPTPFQFRSSRFNYRRRAVEVRGAMGSSTGYLGRSEGADVGIWLVGAISWLGAIFG